jgi:hypothetical protein
MGCVPSPFRDRSKLKETSNFISQLNTCGYSPYVTSSLRRGWVCRLQLLLVLASAVILRSESRETHDPILLSQLRDSPNLYGQVPLFISPQEQGGAVIPLRLAGLRWRDSTRLPSSGKSLSPDASNISAIIAYVFVAAVTFLPGRCLSTIGGYTCSTKNDGRDLRITPFRWGSGAMVCIPSFIKIGAGIQKLMEGYTNTQTALASLTHSWS